MLGDNSITVSSVTFDRTVKIQVSSANVKFDSLSVNVSDSPMDTESLSFLLC